MALSGNTSVLHIWILLAVSLTGVLMGINRTMKTREHESGLLQSLAAVMGLFMMALSVFALLQGGAARVSSEYTALISMILGLSLCARPLEKKHVTLVFALVVGLGIVWAIGHFGIPGSVTELLQKENIRYLVIAAGVVVFGAILLTVFTIEKFVDLFLGLLGLGPIVILLSCIGLSHAVIILATGNSQGVLRYLPWHL